MNARKYMQRMFYWSIIISCQIHRVIQPQKRKKDIPGSAWRGFGSIMECTANSRLVMPLIHPDGFTRCHGPKSSCHIRRSCMYKRQCYKMNQAGKLEMVGASSLGLHSKNDILIASWQPNHAPVIRYAPSTEKTQSHTQRWWPGDRMKHNSKEYL